MKSKIANIVKYFKWIYTAYYYIFSACINTLKLFVKTDDKLILFNSFAGRKYDDSPKAIYEIMRNDSRFKNYKFVWAFHNPDDYVVDGAEKIKTDTLAYFITALKARVWITNSSVERGLNFKGKNTLYFNTWHGTPIKLMGSDIASGNKSFGSKGKNKTDVMCSQGTFETEVFSRVFGIDREKFLEVGLPRNDKFANYTEEYRIALKKQLGIPADKKVILYAPTFREYEKVNGSECVLMPPMNLSFWKKQLSNEYVLLFRAHYEVAKVMDINEDGFVYNMSKYPNLEDLMIVSDMLILDYSSIFFDFSIMDKPMLHFCYDYEKYAKNRGMYFDIRAVIEGADNEEQLIEKILLLNVVNSIEKTVSFRNKYVNFFIAGKGDTEDFLRDLAEKIMLIFICWDIERTLLNSADVFAFPSFREGLSVALMEAMAAGLPCVVSNIRGNVDLIDEEGGFLCKPDCADDFSNGLSELIDNTFLSKQFGLYNMEKMAGFDTEEVLKKIGELYFIV